MHPILPIVTEYLQQEDTILHDRNEFVNALHTALDKHFGEDASLQNNFEFRMSSIGMPLCQIMHYVRGYEPLPLSYTDRMRFVYGDVAEAILILVLKSAGINVEAEFMPVELNIGGINLKGTYDVLIDGEVWDIKSTSAYAFNKFETFSNLEQNDDFGYIAQGILYGEAAKTNFAGWIAFNKNNGEFRLLETPKGYQYDILVEKTLTEVDEKIRYINNAKQEISTHQPIKREFDLEEEKYRKKYTGNKYLPFACSWCAQKYNCYDNINPQLNPFSTAKVPVFRDYVGEVNVKT